ncbi:MAG: AMP-binding protein [Selenomonadaceae bacterium]|nr:AMP-binding protein [Selenomonadaceae bacterium]MBP3722606.1 AMP-binding protein [Selenomonadaceae bacterium]
MFVHELARKGAKDRVAIFDHGRAFTYGEFSKNYRKYRDRLYADGVRAGDRVGIFSRNSAEFIFAYFGVVALGAIAVPINFQLKTREIAYIIKDAGIKMLLTYEKIDLTDALLALGCDTELKEPDIATYGEGEFPEAPPLPIDFSENNPATIIYTSGTTGLPKGAVLSHFNLISNLEQITGLKTNSTHNVLCVLPMYHCFGWTCAVLNTFFSGAKVVILDSFTPKETIETIREEKITDLYLVPSICSLITKLAKPEDMASLRLVRSAGTALPKKIAEDFTTKFGKIISEVYGLSEASPIVTINPYDKTREGSIGKVIPGLQWRIVDGENHDVHEGETGELIVKGANVMLGYWNLEDATEEALRGGWLHTNDVVRADADGYIYIVDRIKDMIISMGENIYPREVEELIYQYPGIYEAAVVGVYDKLRGQAGVCFYTLQNNAENFNPRELKKFLQENLALYKIPREFYKLDKLPRTSTGKIAKRILAAEYEENKKK